MGDGDPSRSGDEDSGTAPDRHGFHNLLSIDVEDYFHPTGMAGHVGRDDWETLPGRVEYTTRRLLNLLEDRRVRATFFVLGWVARRYPSLVKEIHRAGHEVASHGMSHELAYEQSPEAFREDVTASKALLEDLTGAPVRGYRAPSFSITARNRWALEVVAEAGFRYDASVFPIRRQRYGDPDARRDVHRVLQPTWSHDGLYEIPPTTLRLLGRNVPIAGGGYLRAFPLWTTRAAIRWLNVARRRPAVVYLHPWEIDPDQPRVPIRGGDRFRHYLNLDRTEDRLLRLLDTFRFGPMHAALPETVSADEARERTPGSVTVSGTGSGTERAG